MTKSIEEFNSIINESEGHWITKEMHLRDVEKQKQRDQLGIKKKTLFTANLIIKKEYFEGIVGKFQEENKSNPLNELVEDLIIVKIRDGINSMWEFILSDFEPFGKIGQVNVDWVDEQKCSIKIDVFPPYPLPDIDLDVFPPSSQPHFDKEILLYKASTKVLVKFGRYLHEKLLASPNITENQVTLPPIHKEGKRGRPHWEEDIWAHEQVNDLGRPCSDVYKEWQLRINREKRDPVDPKRQFSRIIKPGWLPDKNDNNN